MWCNMTDRIDPVLTCGQHIITLSSYYETNSVQSLALFEEKCGETVPTGCLIHHVFTQAVLSTYVDL